VKKESKGRRRREKGKRDRERVRWKKTPQSAKRIWGEGDPNKVESGSARKMVSKAIVRMQGVPEGRKKQK